MTKVQQHFWSIHLYKLEVVRVSRPLLFSIPPPLGSPLSCLFSLPKGKKTSNSPFSKTSHPPPNIQSKSQPFQPNGFPPKSLLEQHTDLVGTNPTTQPYFFSSSSFLFYQSSSTSIPHHTPTQRPPSLPPRGRPSHCAPRRRARTRACTTARGNVHVASAQPSTRAFELEYGEEIFFSLLRESAAT